MKHTNGVRRLFWSCLLGLMLYSFSVHSQSYSLSNTDPNAPSHEACVGDQITITYNNLTRQPDSIEYNDDSSRTSRLAVVLNGGSGTSGSFDVTIPSNMRSGVWTVQDNNGNSLIVTQNILVHNPDVYFTVPNNPICATDQILLVGHPSGGVFTTVDPNLSPIIRNSTIVGLPARLSGVDQRLWDTLPGGVTVHSVSKEVGVQYSYTPSYTNQATCSNPIETIDTMTIRDNRLWLLRFKPIIRSPGGGNPNQRLRVDNTTFEETSPNILPPTTFTYYPQFSGTYISSGNYFLVDQADPWNRVTMTYSNGGCVGQASGSLIVQEEPNIDGLPDTICSQSTLIDFFRADSARIPYRFRIDTSISRVTTLGTRSSSRIYIREENWVDTVYIRNTPSATAISVTNPAKGYEAYQLNPTLLSGTVTVVMVYKSSRRYYNDSIAPSANYYSYEYTSFVDSQQVVILDPSLLPGISVGPIDSTYCSYDGSLSLTPKPLFDTATGSTFSYLGDDGTGNYVPNNTLGQDTTFDPQQVFNAFVLPTIPRDLNVQIIYEAENFGCTIRDTAYTRIIAPLALDSDKADSYCIDALPVTINITSGGAPISGLGGQFIHPSWMDGTGQNAYSGVFTPSLQGVGAAAFEYRFIDQYGCESMYVNTLVVNDRPQFELAFDSDPNKRTFCANEAASLMSVSSMTNVIDSAFYVGRGITDSIFNPTIAYNGRTTYQIIATAIDTLGCQNADTVDVTITEPPQVNIDVAFNNRGRTLPNGMKAFCHNDTSFVLQTSPSYLGWQVSNPPFLGNGIVYAIPRREIRYNPNSAAPGSIDTVIFHHIDSNGCSNRDTALIQIDSTPNVQLTGLASPSYCKNQDPVQLVGTPVPSQGRSGASYYSGSGVNPNTGVFDPDQARIGSQVLRYTFTSLNGCVGFAEDTVVINVRPRADFGGIKLINPQYCMLDPVDTLWSLNDTTIGSYAFWGDVIIDGVLGTWQPDTSRGVNPDTAGNFQTIYYAYTAANGCTDTTSKTIFVNPMPVIDLWGLDSIYCGNVTNGTVIMSHDAEVDTSSGNTGVFSWLGNRLTVHPSAADTGYTSFTMLYTDPASGCSDTVSSRIYIYEPVRPYFTSMGQTVFDTVYCAQAEVVPLVGTPLGGTFSGAGIVATDTFGNYGFLPYGVGNGRHFLNYAIRDTFDNGVDQAICLVDTQVQVTVYPLPRANMQSPRDNSRFCSTDGLITLNPQPVAYDSLHLFSNPNGRIATQSTFYFRDSMLVFGNMVYDTVFIYDYYFNPDSASTDSIFTDYQITHIAINTYGCADTTTYNYSVNLFEPASFAIDTVFCQNDNPVFLSGTPTSNGVFMQDGDTMRIDPNTGVITFYPVTDTLAGGRFGIAYYDLNYSYDNGFCSGDTSILVRVDTAPIVSFMHTHDYRLDVFCLGDEPTALRPIPNQSGGVFEVNGIPLIDTIFNPDILGAGEYVVQYRYVEPATMCEGTYEDTLYIYGMPDMAYRTVGGCQWDSVHFIPTTAGLDNYFQGRLMDSITSVDWLLEPGLTVQGTAMDSNRVDDIRYLYSAPGVYNTQLIVANQVHCVDTQDFRLVVSPTINSYPYDESFENGAGNWFAESRDASHPLLWEWGRDNNPSGIPASTSNHFWATGLNQAYQSSEDAWVYSPCFDLDSLSRPMISLDYWMDTRSRIDGTILEYQKDDGTWAPLGEVGRGINWFNERFIAGQPGDAHLPPIGWAGRDTSRNNARYKLDGFGEADNVVRLRMAFGSSPIPTTSYYDGFAFDNVWVGNRTRNVLLETTTNIGEPGMTNINAHVYNLVFHTDVNKDVTMIQYHTDEPEDNDQFYLNMAPISNLRTLDYGSNEAGRAYIDGSFINFASALTDANFEMDMLQDPKFSINIHGGLQYMAGQETFVLSATVTALEDMPQQNYRIYTTITEDSLEYQNNISYPDQVHAVVRQDDDNAHLMYRSWAAGDTANVTLVWDHSNAPHINYRPGRFQGVVFIQAKESTYKEVFQVATTRDISGYWVGVDPTIPVVQDQYQEVQTMTLFPNPARDHFNVRFDAPLSTDYAWQLIDLRGATVRTGAVPAGTEQFQVDDLEVPSGTYVLVLFNGQVFTERKVVLAR